MSLVVNVQGVTVFEDTFEQADATRHDDATDPKDAQWRPRIGSQAGAYTVISDAVLGKAIKYRQSGNFLWIIAQFDSDASDGVTLGSNSIPATLGPFLNDTLELSLRLRVGTATNSTRAFNVGLLNVPGGPLTADPGTDATWINSSYGYYARFLEGTAIIPTYKQIGSPGTTPYQGVAITNLTTGIPGVSVAFAGDTAPHTIVIRLTRVETGIQIETLYDGTLVSSALDDGSKGGGVGGMGPYETFNTVAMLYGSGSMDYILDDVKLVSAWARYEPPVANDDSYTTDQDTTLTVSAPGLVRNDLSYTNNPPLAAIKVSDPEHGILSAFDGNGRFTYVPGAGFHGTDAFTYKANDGSGESSPATVTIQVRNTGYVPPTAVNDSYSLGQNTTFAVPAPGVIGNDLGWTNLGPLTASKLTDPAHGTLSSLAGDGSFTYVPEPNYSGTDSFSYRVTDGEGNSATGMVSLLIINVADRAFISLKPFCARPDGQQTCVAVVKLFNASGGPNSGQSVTLISSRGALDVIGPSNPALTDANGEARFTVKSSVAGSTTLTADWNGSIISRGIIQDGAVGIWSFEGDAKDASGANNHGTAQNAPAFVAGKSGQAIQLNGINQFVEVAHNNSLNNRRAWTIDAWIYLDSLPTARSVVLQKSSSSDGDFYLSCSNKLLRARCATRGGADSLNQYSTETANSVLAAGRWTHVVAVWAGIDSDPVWDDGSLRTFVDGEEKKNWEIARYLCRNNAQPLNIGRSPAGGNHFQGRLDEVKLYNRPLYPPEIQRSYEFSTKIHFNLTSPAGLTAQHADPESIQLWWTGGVNTNITSYRIYRSQSPGVTAAASNLLDEVPYFIHQNRDWRVQHGVRYYYVVTAMSYGNESAPSAEVSAVANKAPSAPGWYGGDTHIHSAYSWDVYYHPPAELATTAKSRGFDFLFITDHNSIAGRHELSTNSTATFLGLTGEEVSLATGGDNDHFNAFFINKYVDIDDAEVQLHERVRAQGGLAYPNHCGYYTETTNIDGLEVIHGASVKSSTVDAWDWYLKQGYKLMGRGSTDNHGDAGKVTTLVWLDRLCYSEMYDAFKYGRACAVTGPGIECMLQVNGAMIGDTLRVAAGTALNVQVTAESDANLSTIQLVKHGVVVWSGTPSGKSFAGDYSDVSGSTNTYYRLRVVDSAGKTALGGAVYIEHQAAIPISIQSSAGSGGSISPAGAIALYSGGTTNFEVIAASDYRIADIKTNGVSVGVPFNNTAGEFVWTWNNIETSGTIVAQFVPRLTPNGIPFPWLASHDIALRDPSVEQLDSDDDGFTNLEEYQADTDPVSELSGVPDLQIRVSSLGVPEVFVTPSSTARSYLFLSTGNLESALWETNYSSPGNGAALVLPLTNAVDARFYRFRVQP